MLNTENYRFSAKDLLKSGHSISLNEHVKEPVDMLRSRSNRLLLSRGPSYPSLAIDLSSELATENISRRSLHREVLTAEPTAFRRKKMGESSSAFWDQQHLVKDLLSDMHPLKDTKDLNPKKSNSYTYTVKEEETKLSINDSASLEDFIRPEDSESPRRTGYEKGHIRSVFKLDVYGPSSSKHISKSREFGQLPLSPNVNRYEFLDPERIHTGKSTMSHNSSLGQGSLDNLSRKSTPNIRLLTPIISDGNNDYNNITTSSLVNSIGNLGSKYNSKENLHDYVKNMNHPSHNQNRNNDTLNTASTSQTAFTASTRGTNSRERRSRTSTPFAGTVGYHGPALTIDDRLLIDPYVKRLNWSNNYIVRKKEQAEFRDTLRKKRAELKEKIDIESQTRQSILDFENKLAKQTNNTNTNNNLMF
eukprot:gene11603-15537_t